MIFSKRSANAVCSSAIALLVVFLFWVSTLPLSASGIVQSAYNLVQNGGSSLTRRTTLNCDGSTVICSDSGGKTLITAPGSGSSAIHSITFVLDGGGVALTTGPLASFPTAAYACTINRMDVSADQSGSITVDIWKAAGAIPTGANKISASAPATLSSAQLHQNGSLTGWTTSVSSGDVFGGTIASTSTVQRVTVQIWCQ